MTESSYHEDDSEDFLPFSTEWHSRNVAQFDSFGPNLQPTSNGLRVSTPSGAKSRTFRVTTTK